MARLNRAGRSELTEKLAARTRKPVRWAVLLGVAVVVVASTGCSADGEPPPAPAAPTSLNATSTTSDRVGLSWNHTFVGSSPQRGIAVARKTRATGIWSVVGSVPQDRDSYQDTGLTPNTTYFYKIYAYESYDPGTISAYSAEASATTAEFTVAPAAPSDVAANAVHGWEVSISWTDNAANEDGFIVERSFDNVSFAEVETVGPDMVSINDHAVVASTLYYYRVRAFNNAGESVNAATSLTTPDITPTNLSGGIANDITLTAADSPYQVSADVVLAPGYTMIIEPGVHLRFASGVGMEMRGHLEAVGNSSAPIVFTAADPSTANQGAWSGIHVANNLGGSAIIQHAQVSFASAGISVDCCWGGGPAGVYDTIFEGNSTAFGDYAGWDSLIYRSLFRGNGSGVDSADKIIAYSKFLNNNYGLNATERVSVYFSIFEGHTGAALYGGRRAVWYSTIRNNTIGVQSFFEGFNLSYNDITNNLIGIELGSYNSSMPSVNYNNIVNNATYNMVNNDTHNQDATNNWWGTTDPAQVEAGIRDFFDDAGLGIINYAPFLQVPIDIIP